MLGPAFIARFQLVTVLHIYILIHLLRATLSPLLCRIASDRTDTKHEQSHTCQHHNQHPGARAPRHQASRVSGAKPGIHPHPHTHTHTNQKGSICAAANEPGESLCAERLLGLG